MTRNGHLVYHDANDKPKRRQIWVTEISQPHELQGQSAQSRLARHFYARAYAPGVLTVKGICRTQVEYQQLARFIRSHHEHLMQTLGMRFTPRSASSKRLLLLHLPSEDIEWRGWVTNFTLAKKGVFEPSPEFTLNFFPAFDDHSIEPAISGELRAEMRGHTAPKRPISQIAAQLLAGRIE